MSDTNSSTVVSQSQAEELRAFAILDSGYRAGDAFSASFLIERYNRRGVTEALFALLSYLSGRSIFGMSSSTTDMRDAADVDPGWPNPFESGAINRYESEGELYGWLSRDTSAGKSEQDITGARIDISTDGVDTYLAMRLSDGRCSEITLRGVVPDLNQFAITAQEASSLQLSGSYEINGSTYGLAMDTQVIPELYTWNGTEENHVLERGVANWVNAAGEAATYKAQQMLVFGEDGYKTVTISRDPAPFSILVEDDYTFCLETEAALSVSSTFEIAAGATLSLHAAEAVSLDFSISGAGNLSFVGGEWSVLVNQLYTGTTTVENASLSVTHASLGGGAVTLGSGAQLVLQSAYINSGENNMTLREGASLQAFQSALLPAAILVESGASAVIDSSSVSHLVVSDGASVTLTDCESIEQLTLSLNADYTISGNDFSNTQIILTDLAPGSTIDLSGNAWGVNSLEQIQEILGEYAPYVVINDFLPSFEKVIIDITNTNDSGEGSLRAAINLLNTYPEGYGIALRFADELRGSTISLSSALPAITRSCVIRGGGIALTGNATLTAQADITLRDISLSSLRLENAASLVTESVTLTAQDAIRLQNWSGSADFSGITATASGACVVVYGNLNDASLPALPATLSGGYRNLDSNSISISGGKTTRLEEGARLQLQNWSSLNVYGTLTAENEVAADVLTGTGSSDEIHVRDGGKLLLKNANVYNVEQLYLYYGGELAMTGGTLDTRENLVVSAGSEATLNGVTVKDWVDVYGTLNAEGSEFRSYVYVTNSANVKGSGNTFSGAETYRIGGNFTGETSALWAAIGATTAENACVGVTGNLDNCTL
ncbi:MAG: hypothetical protein IJB00_00655, partial [Akkermansia sp.]|nr:hypothetical protein [Akkermansia sp.]